MNFPDTLLGSLSHSSEYYEEETKSYYFDRNPNLFNKILDLYRIGNIHISADICGATLREELDFWQIPPTLIGECCLQYYFKYDDDIAVLNKLRRNFDDLDYKEEECAKSRFKRCLRFIWRTMDQPLSSIYGRVSE